MAIVTALRERGAFVAIELAADRQTRLRRRRDGDSPPRTAVELDRDERAPLAERRDGRHRTSPGQASAGTSSAIGTSASAEASIGASVDCGSSRADTTCSGPASAWIRWRIDCTRSGFSERKAVAF